MTGRRPPGREDEPDRARQWRLYTLATDGARLAEWVRRGELERVRDLLERPGVAVSIAGGGQLQLPHLADPPPPGDRVAACLEGDPVRVLRTEWVFLADLVQEAYRAGATKAGMLADRLPHADLRRLGVDRASALDADLAPYRAGALLRLAAWVATKEEM